MTDSWNPDPIKLCPGCNHPTHHGEGWCVAECECPINGTLTGPKPPKPNHTTAQKPDPKPAPKLAFHGKEEHDLIRGPRGGIIVWAAEITEEGKLCFFCESNFNTIENLNDIILGAELMKKRLLS